MLQVPSTGSMQVLCHGCTRGCGINLHEIDPIWKKGGEGLSRKQAKFIRTSMKSMNLCREGK